MAQISIDNGNSFCTIEEALEEIDIDTLAQYMDDDIREDMHNDLAPCDDVEFLTEYLSRATDDLIMG